MAKKKSPVKLVKEAIQLIEESIKNIDYINSVCWIFGLTIEDVPNQTALFYKLLEQRQEFKELLSKIRAFKKNGRLPTVLNIVENIAAFKNIVQSTLTNKENWKDGPIKILCSDRKLIEIALKIKEEGYINLNKEELEKHFDFSNVVTFWDRIPSYTTFILGGGMAVSSPEFDLFEAMCWSYNEAVRTNTDMRDYKEKIGKPDVDVSVYRDIIGHHLIMCRQTLINAFLLIEAFINSLAHASMADPSKSFTDEQKLYLCERVKDKNGLSRKKFVSIDNKLTEWTKMISPSGKTFNKGNKPFQDFIAIKDYRDSIVHLSAPKVKDFRDIDFKVASKAVSVALEMIEKISEYTSSDSNNIEYPFWLTKPQADSLFHVSKKLELSVKGI